MVDTHSANTPLASFDPKIYRTISRLRRAPHLQEQTVIMAEDNPTLRQLNAPDLGQQYLAVIYPALGDGVNFELK